MGNFVLDTFIEKIEIFSKNVFDILSNNEEYRNEEQLYHYTSFNAVQAIIKNKSFRASSIYTTNDPNDLHHGHKHICDWYTKDISDKLRVNFERNNTSEEFSAFIFSLSEL